jgi:hypothetical protein
MDRNGHGRLTFSINPVGVQIRQGCLVADLLECLERLMIHLEDATRSPPPAHLLVCHALIDTSAARVIGSLVVGDGAREEDWRRQLGGIERNGDWVGFRGALGKVGGEQCSRRFSCKSKASWNPNRRGAEANKVDLMGVW